MKPYRPVGGIEGKSFMAAFCENCVKKGTADMPCPILCAATWSWPGEPCYPGEWVSEDDGSRSRCTAFELVVQCRFLGEKL